MSIPSSKSPKNQPNTNLFQSIGNAITSIFSTISKELHSDINPLDPKYLDFLAQQKLLQGLTTEELQYFCRFVKVEEFPSEIDLIKEGELSQDIYFIFEGEVSLLKWDETSFNQLMIGHLMRGSIFGEMAFIDGDPRSVTVRTTKPTTIIKFNPEIVNKKNLKMKEIYDTILFNIAKTSISRLRSSNRDYVKSLQTQIDFGSFFIISITIFGLGNLVPLIAKSYHVSEHSFLFSWSLLISLSLPYLLLIKNFNLSLNEVGITTDNWKKSLTEGLIISSIVILTSIFIYWIYSLTHIGSRPVLNVLFNPIIPFTLMDILYFLHGYIQEFMARGINQGSLQKFLRDERGLRSLVLTSVMFGIFHVSRGIEAAATAFIGSLFFGYIYLRHHNLIGVAIVHYTVGLIVINYLGLI